MVQKMNELKPWKQNKNKKKARKKKKEKKKKAVDQLQPDLPNSAEGMHVKLVFIFTLWWAAADHSINTSLDSPSNAAHVLFTQ